MKLNRMTSDPLWEEALQYISQQLNDQTFKMWFQPAVGLGLSEGTYCVGVASEFARDWMETRFQSLVTEALCQAAGEPVRVEIVVSPALSQALAEDDIDIDIHTTARASGRWGATATSPTSAASLQPAQPPEPRSPHGPAVAATEAEFTYAHTGLMRKYTFDTFVTGSSNRFAHAAALATAETPGTQYNPLFIYGGVGLGKTHLLQAIGNYVVDNHPGLKVRYLTLETFTNDFINSLRDDSIEGFKTKYRTVDVLLIDDIQFLHKKEQTQEEFFHTFNTLFDAQKQIVITSDRHPKVLAGLEDRLVSRFEWGLITDIQPPDLETRVAILRKKVRLDNIPLADEDVLMLIASRVPNNIRELEGCLTRVVAYSSFTKRPINVDLAREVLKDIPEEPAHAITIDDILSAVAQVTGVSPIEMTGDKRSRQVVESRHLAMYLARELTDASLPKIGERFGGRDHTTVLHAVDKISTLMQHDRTLYNRVQRLIATLKAR